MIDNEDDNGKEDEEGNNVLKNRIASLMNELLAMYRIITERTNKNCSLTIEMEERQEQINALRAENEELRRAKERGIDRTKKLLEEETKKKDE